MKTSPSTRRRGFTLVEMLAVITIIVILAAVILGSIKFVKDKQNSSKASIQIALLAKAIQEYKLDNGNYPPSTSNDGTGQTKNLRQVLYLDGVNDATKQKKTYVPELDETNKQQWISGTGSTAIIVDPWGNEYRYRTGTSALNPDFDLWSCGKDGVTSEDDPKNQKSLDDVRAN